MSVLLLTGLLCVVAGVLLGLLGGGGSILAVPVLVYAAGLDPRSAIATSLLVVGVSSAVAALGHGFRGSVDVRAGLTLGLASMVGALVGGRLGQYVPEAILLGIFTAIMVITAVAMMRKRADAPCDETPRTAARMKTIVIGLAIGALTGLVGAGGGFVVVPALVLLAGLPIRRAVGTSVFVIALNAMAGFAGAASAATIDPWIAGVAVVGASVGSLGGVAVSTHVPAKALRKVFAWFVLAMAVFMVVKQLPEGTLEAVRGSASHIIAAVIGAAAVAAVWLLVHVRHLLGGHSRPTSSEPTT